MVRFKFWKKEVKPKLDNSSSNASKEEEKEYKPPELNSTKSDDLYKGTTTRPTRIDEA